MSGAGRVARRVEILVLNWNGLEDTLECARSVLASRFDGELLLRLIDNGSAGDDADRLSAAFARDPSVRVERNPDNLGFAAGMNKALREALEPACPPDYVVLLNNDTVVAPDWLQRLVAAAEATGAQLVGSRMVNYFEPGILDNAGHEWLNTGEILPRGAGAPADGFDRGEWLVGACAGAILYRPALLEAIGLFDPYFHTGYEDAEHGLRAFLAGHPTWYEPTAVVRHKVSRSIDKVRDFRYSVGIQRNINYTILKLTPAAVLALNGAFILLKTVAVPLTALLFGRITLFRAHLCALLETARDLQRALGARRRARGLRRANLVTALGAQRFFLGVYWGYFRRYLLTGRRTVFER